MEYDMNNKTIRGTPEEIMEFIKLGGSVQKKKMSKPKPHMNVKMTKPRKHRRNWTKALGTPLKDIVKKENPQTPEEQESLVDRLLQSANNIDKSNANRRRLMTRIKIYAWMNNKGLL
jgi:hypothetical protein